jgi:dimethylaniline monooxygenase (N-oxide forming)
MSIFPPEHADSLALISNIHPNGPQISDRELGALSVAHIWPGNSSLPPLSEMDSWVHQHNTWLAKRLKQSPCANRGDIRQLQWQAFVHDAAGTGLLDSFGWVWKAWSPWWQDPELYKALAHDPVTGHALRLFKSGKRAAWRGHAEAVLDAYRSAAVSLRGLWPPLILLRRNTPHNKCVHRGA